MNVVGIEELGAVAVFEIGFNDDGPCLTVGCLAYPVAQSDVYAPFVHIARIDVAAIVGHVDCFGLVADVTFQGYGAGAERTSPTQDTVTPDTGHFRSYVLPGKQVACCELIHAHHAGFLGLQFGREISAVFILCTVSCDVYAGSGGTMVSTIPPHGLSGTENKHWRAVCPIFKSRIFQLGGCFGSELADDC